MPLSIMKAAWVANTARSGHPRGALLEALDAAIDSGNPFRALAALSNWIGAQAEANADWRNHPRNGGRAFTKLYVELNTASLVKPWLDRLLAVTVACRAGSRVLQVIFTNDRLEQEYSASAAMWRDCGMDAIVQEDTRNGLTYYETIGELGREARNGTIPGVLKGALRRPPAGLALGGLQPFQEWSRVAVGNCVEMGSGDATLWIESVCLAAGLNVIPYRGPITTAKTRGADEHAAFEVARANRAAREAGMNMPLDAYAAANGVRAYLREFARINRDKRDQLVAAAYPEVRQRMRDSFLLADDDPDLLTWHQARR